MMLFCRIFFWLEIFSKDDIKNKDYFSVDFLCVWFLDIVRMKQNPSDALAGVFIEQHSSAV